MAFNRTAWLTGVVLSLVAALPAFAQVVEPEPVLNVTPGVGFLPSGPVGGPFAPGSQDYVLSNTGSDPITWIATADQPWVSLSPASGSIGGGGQVTVTAGVNDVTSGLAAGSYTATITFGGTGGSTTRPVTLTVSAAGVAGPMTVAPGGGLSSSGPSGGPFTPSSIDYTVTNTGAASMTWTASTASTFIALSATGGTLDGGETATVTVSIADGASDFSPGLYSGTVAFANTTNGVGNTTRPVTLTIGTTGAGAVMDVTPDADYVVTGPVGGPFTPVSQVYSVKNAGTSDMSVTVTANQTWVSLLTPSATIAPGLSSPATVMIGETAASLGVGTYTATITFTNTTNGVGNTTRSVSLTVTGGGSGGMSVTPATGINASGPVGGPFVNASQNYVITNLSADPLDWSATATVGWMTVTPAGGTLAANASQTIAVFVNDLANALPAAIYSDTVTFADANGAATTRSVQLTVTGAPDTEPPTVTIVTPAPPTALTTASPIAISGTASDNVSVTSVNWANATTGGAGTATGTTAWSASVPLAAGDNLITFTAKDAGGNGGLATITITYTPVSNDTTPPVITIFVPTGLATHGTSTSPVTVGGRATDNVGVATVTWHNAATGQSGTATGTRMWSAPVPLNVGANVVTVSAFDAAGNSSTDTITIEWTPPVKAKPSKRSCGGSAGASGGSAVVLLAMAGVILAFAARR